MNKKVRFIKPIKHEKRNWGSEILLAVVPKKYSLGKTNYEGGY